MDKWCKPILKNKDLDVSFSVSGVPLDPEAYANPCGLVAKSIFNDTYELKRESGASFKISADGVAWPSDKKYKYANHKDWEDVQWLDVENERFFLK